MGASRCFSPVRGRAMRVTRLDGCGRPIYGDDSVGVSDGFVSVAFTATTDEGEEINVVNAAGKTCVREVPCPTLLGYGVEIQFCQVDPALFAVLTGQDADLDYTGAAAGFRINSDISACDSGFALELWTGVPGVACDPNATGGDAEPAGYLLVPYLQGGIFGDFTVENGAISFTVTGAATKTGSGWGVGPYDVVRGQDGPQPLEQPIVKGDHMVVRYTDVPAPAPSCGTKPLLDPAGAPLTSVGAGADGLDVTFTPTPSGTDAWWVDFGDGTWDYDATGADIAHTYAAAGTYQWVAYRGTTTQTGEVIVAVTPPTITTVAPATGAAAGGTAVTLTGTGFTGATRVTFGGTPGTAFAVTDATHISVATPPHAAGAVDVVVQHPAGNATKAGGFTYS